MSNDARNAKGQFKPGTSGNPGGGKAKERVQANLDSGKYEARRDGWTSALTGIGDTQRDKRLSHSFQNANLSYADLAAMWLQDPMFAKAIEKPSQACFSEGYELNISDEEKYSGLKEEVEDLLLGLELDEALEQCDQLQNAFGGGALLLGADDGRALDQPLAIDRIRKLEWINVLEPMEIAPVALYNDPMAPKYGKPEYFQIYPFDRSGENAAFLGAAPKKVRPPKQKALNIIHESRLMVFPGLKTSKYFYPTTDISPYWGVTKGFRFYDSLRDFAISCAGLGVLAIDVSQPVIAIDGLKEKVGKDETALKNRFAAIELSRSIARAIVIDAKSERYERQTTQTAGIPEIWDRLALRFCADADIPLSVALGYSPASLGQPGETEQKLWNKIIRSMQRRKMGPRVRFIVSMLMRTLRQRKLPKKWKIDWHDLEYLTLKDQSELELNQARTDALQVKNGTVYPNEIRMSRWKGGFSQKTQIDEKKKAPGILPGVLPGALPGSTIATGQQAPAPASGAAAAPNAHAVKGYARRNPAQPAAPAPKNGGDMAPADSRDANAGDVVDFAGFRVLIENPKGSTRPWVDSDGTAGETKMPYDYGELVNTLGTDGDPVDAFLGPSPDSTMVAVIHQMKKSSGFTQYDEDKVMLGFDSPNHARDAYLRAYNDDRFLGSMEIMSLEDFRKAVMFSPGAPVQVMLDESDIVACLDRIEHRGDKWVVMTEDGSKELGSYSSEAEAIHRLAQIETFKRASAG